MMHPMKVIEAVRYLTVSAPRAACGARITRIDFGYAFAQREDDAGNIVMLLPYLPHLGCQSEVGLSVKRLTPVPSGCMI